MNPVMILIAASMLGQEASRPKGVPLTDEERAERRAKREAGLKAQQEKQLAENEVTAAKRAAKKSAKDAGMTGKQYRRALKKARRAHGPGATGVPR